MSTKQLARELGILRKRSRCDLGPHDSIKKVRKSIQVYDYLIVIDFESTCWQDVKHRTQEIIEFPAVLLNTESGVIENEFHHYVQPQESPLLSDFCKKLTGITQESVDDGIPLYLCLRRFSYWLAELKTKKNIAYNAVSVKEDEKTCTFVTWSDWDLAVCLQYECRRKQLRKPQELNSWIDLRATYRQYYGRRPQGLNGALQEIGITFEGREHSGLHDARNTARLAWHMMKDGCVMQITKSLTTRWGQDQHQDYDNEAQDRDCDPQTQDIYVSTNMNETGSSCSLVTSNNVLNKVNSPKREPTKKTQDDDIINKQSEKIVYMNCGKSPPNVKSVRQAFAVNQLHLGNGKQLVAKMQHSSDQSSPDKNCSEQNQIANKEPTYYKLPSPDRKNFVQLRDKQILPIEKSVGLRTCGKQSSLGKNSVDEMRRRDEKSSPNASACVKQIVCNSSVILSQLSCNEDVMKSHKPAVSELVQTVSDAVNNSAGGAVLTATEEKSPKSADLRNGKECTKLANSVVDGLVETTPAVLTSADGEESSPIVDLYGLNVADWFEDDFFDGNEVAFITLPINNAIDCVKTTVSSSADKNEFLLHSDLKVSASFSKETDSNRCRPNKPLHDVTNTVAKSVDGRIIAKTSIMKSSSPRSRSSVTITPVEGARQSNNIPTVKPLSSVNACFKPPAGIAGELRTPVASSPCSFQGLGVPMSWKTPSSTTPMNSTDGSLMKKTPPLCECGCRCKRKFVQRPGPNLGRSFFCCGSSSMSKSNCKFFKWEINITSPASSSSCNSSVKSITPSSSGMYTSFGSSARFGVTPVSVRPRFVSVTRVLVPPN